MSAYVGFEPLDVLMPRGNRLFGGGVHGESLMPPWPSVFSGALASRALADAAQ
jgi:CRISPR-associated protein Cmr3